MLERVADTVTPQPVLAVVPMLAGPGPDVLAARPGSLVMVLVDVRDPGNAGTVLRAADASGATAVLFAADSVDPYNPKTVRASAGSLFHIPFAVRSDDPACRRRRNCSDGGFRTLATVVRHGDDYTDFDWSVPSAVFLGNESSGLDERLCQRLDAALGIPMEGRAESLNVGVASAVVGFEAARQRRAGGGGARSISPDADEGGTLRHGD